MVRTSVKQSPLLERLLGGGVLISDGATGTYLQSHGLEPGGCPEEFNASHPETVRQMAKDYFDAGSDMVLTNSFGANKFMLKKYGHGDRVATRVCNLRDRRLGLGDRSPVMHDDLPTTSGQVQGQGTADSNGRTGDDGRRR